MSKPLILVKVEKGNVGMIFIYSYIRRVVLVGVW